ncbi:VOC family protein [Xylophilus sp. GOD-11R]|uniref:VOC family protein n=1 Tax=Xylophilus sp. GOD-11R TaxID=3089814 RepID=UPI00298D04DD|nr:VOC family protein [Xylophilus sp. GOD-11R]WPB56304.1 VOC family protein [Xylophilus sp. GOD-11R]
MPIPGLTLDHVGLAVFDLEAARVAFERMGFTLAPRSMHAGTMTAGGAVEPWGSGNHCAMFRRGYFEVLGLVDPALPSNVKKMLDRYQGMHIVALRCDSADAGYAALQAAGVRSEAPMALERDAIFGPANDGVRRAIFRNTYLDQTQTPEARFIVIEHVTPEVLWQPHLLDHDNGAQALAEIIFVTDDLAATEQRFTRFAGAPTRQGDALRFDLAAGSLRVMTEAALRAALPAELAAAPLHRVAGAGIEVTSLDALETLFQARGVRYVRATTLDGAAPALWVGPEHAAHGILQFTQSI